MQATPHPIETKSYSLLEQDLQALYPEVLRYRPLMRAVVKRVVHSTGDITLADDLVMSETDLNAAVQAIHANCPIITDVQMTTSGIGGLSGFSRKNPVIGAITLGIKPPEGQTRSYAGMMRACKQIAGGTCDTPTSSSRADSLADSLASSVAESATNALVNSASGELKMGSSTVEEASKLSADKKQPYIVVVGCSPTSVFALIEAVKEGMHPPVLCIGTPVGYVDAKESKMQLRESGIPCVTNTSMRGGAAVAAAIFNALRYHPRHPGDEKP